LLIFSFASFSAYSQLIEKGIALTIIISAIHALRPLFYSKEMLFTFLFGLIHGSAFALSLAGYDLNSGQKFLFILGFNIGIELMQLLVILCFIPVIYCSRFAFYKYIRIAGAVLAVIAGIEWLVV
jgi:HupE / UreJ protein